ncbi:extracellular solute-binding protein [Streptomonospora nanhaiensis]|uniref:N,N'-diacetylchitobiose transport system substrate-binding protein n=1 Tax=Streptomonospora nanhaiensis TaxID=1323731 RepID=A0A853BLP2_9ACTN|nr:extracellular solute-binding protein [Streptomonospora nanhaiensis]MBV2363110.1 extracellular solute-binding protein [Streptomonospora nanhaiensis]MBX9390388.1 extracellular solute-binding protein [Streptomonospora nanhaiensis]NYI95481.1 N,N'-diacetylchitobiose transport system substrate-binding protein [Streptomonospora nanhaiensis]
MRSLKTATVTTAVLLAAAACGQGGSGGGTDPSEAPESLTVWVMGTANDPLKEYFDTVEQRYQETYPDTAVEVEFISWPDAQQSINNALAGGDAPDVLEVGNDQVANWAAQGALMDITSHTEEWAAVGEMDQAAVEYGTYEGAQYGIPWFSGVRTLYYRADWLEDIGMEPPTTWDELVEVAKAIEDEKGVPGFAAPTDFTNGIASFIWSNGGEIATMEGDSWEGRLTSPETQEAIEFYAGLTTEEEVSPQSYVGENELVPLADMANGEVGMYIDGGWALTSMEEQAEDPAVLEEIGAAPIPGAEGIAPAFAGGSALTVFATTEHPDFAFELLKVMGDQEGGKGYADAAGYFPAYPEMLDDESYQSDPVTAAAAEQMRNTKFFPTTPNWNAADQDGKILPGAVLDIVRGEDPDEVLRAANEELTEVLNEPVE